MADHPPRVLAIASAGGHWVQLLRLAPAFDGCEMHFATSFPEARAEAEALAEERGQPKPGFHSFTNANIRTRRRLLRQMIEVVAIVLTVRPQVIVSTGASAGYFAIRAGRLLGARCLWLDSLANVEKPSLSGRRAGPIADLYLTQWPHLATEEGPEFRGTVLPGRHVPSQDAEATPDTAEEEVARLPRTARGTRG